MNGIDNCIILYGLEFDNGSRRECVQKIVLKLKAILQFSAQKYGVVLLFD